MEPTPATVSARPAALQDILPWRDMYREEMSCQIIHDSLHSRKGWAQPYLLFIGDVIAGYGAVAVGGPWTGKPAIFEFYVVPRDRGRVFDLFSTIIAASGAKFMEVQSNDSLITTMLHAFAENVATESILFHDKLTTTLTPAGAIFRQATPDDAVAMQKHDFDPEARWVVEVGGAVIAAGDILFHYNRPYGDIYMSVAEPFRRRGLGAYLVQELKRICYEQGSVPAARCNPKNVPSRKTLQRAGFVPCGHILTGSLAQIEK